jgi:hypothetical protein
MRTSLRTTLIALTALLTMSAVSSAQAAPARTGTMADLIADMHDVHGKLVALAKAIPADKYDWRPDPGVRSIGEVLLHVASDNYLMPSAWGVAPDPSTGINPTDFKTLTAFEKQKVGTDAMVAALNKSFAHLAKAMGDTPDSKLKDKVKMFGQEFTTEKLWLGTVTHLHEHLGQSIAYARMNHITPPWSKGGM